MRTLQFFIDKLERTYDLAYIDYRESLDEHLNLIQEAIRNGNKDNIWEEIGEWYGDQETESAYQYAQNCLKEADATDEEIEEYTDDIEQEIYQRNNSDTVADLLKNTRDQFMYYELGLDIEKEPWSMNEKELTSYCKKIAKAAKIDYETNKKDLWTLLTNATCGGFLVYYWADYPARYIDSKIKSIEFDDGCLCIMDRGGGSGFDMGIKGPAKFKFDSKSIKLDDASGGYSYGNDVCGLTKSYYTKYSPCLEKGKKDRPTPESLFRERSEYVHSGNIIANTQYGSFIRPYDEIGCWVGASKEKGNLRAWDIEHFPCTIPKYVLEAIKAHPEQLNLINFHVNLGKKEKKHIGWILLNDKKEIVYEKAEDYYDFEWAKEKLLASINKNKF